MNRARRATPVVAGLCLLLAVFGQDAAAQEGVQASVGADVVSRYIWRGLNAADAPSVQPSIAFTFGALEVGTWGSYSLSNGITAADEMDFWLGYSRDFGEGGSFGLLLTDYYFPNGGQAFSDFSNYDDADGPGAHLFEIGASLGLPGSVPLTISAYVNVHNDEGHNVYLHVDYPVTLGETEVNFFAGASPGSEKNPDYYGTDGFSFLDVGVQVTKNVSISDQFSLPLTGTWLVNPNLDIAYLVIGFSL